MAVHLGDHARVDLEGNGFEEAEAGAKDGCAARIGSSKFDDGLKAKGGFGRLSSNHFPTKSIFLISVVLAFVFVL